jgi:probable HAF family extracellular repeat protein
MRFLAFAAAAAVTALAGAAQATPVGFSHTVYDVPGAEQSYLRGLNDLNQFVGGYNSGGTSHAFFTQPDGTPIGIARPDGRRISVEDINSSGTVVGYTELSPTSGFTYSGGTFTDLNVPGADGTYAWGINDAGTVAGYYFNSSGFFGYTYAGGTYTSFSVPGAAITAAYDINNAGHMAGQYQMTYAGPIQSFLFNGTNYVDIAVPGASMTQAWGLNDLDQVVGVFMLAEGGDLHNFLYDGTDYLTFDLTDERFSFAYGVNNAGLIVGNVVDRNFNATGYYGTIGEQTPEPPPPGVPEPMSAALLLLGLLGPTITMRVRRRRRTA